ncbi:alpha/beta-hydrolase [Clavulina sp. PMI_390]|nr:alpha/beta-hydrolase [Clavulina sp. PMI_390]
MSIFTLPGWKNATLNKKSYHYIHIPATLPKKPTLLLFHGFPTGVLAFRKLVPRLVGEGYGVVLPELLGYGASSKPQDVSEYSRIGMADAMAELLMVENVQKVIALGHDWGSPIAVRFALKYPMLAERIILVGVPFRPPGEGPLDTSSLNNRFKPTLGYEPLAYMDWLASPEAPRVTSEHPEALVRLMFDKNLARVWCDRGALGKSLEQDVKPSTPAWISEADMRESIDFVKKQDMFALLNYYQFATRIFEEEEKVLPQRLTLPFLYIDCQNDPTINAAVDYMKPHCDDMTVKSFAAGHWVLEEDPDGAGKTIIEWLSDGK